MMKDGSDYKEELLVEQLLMFVTYDLTIARRRYGKLEIKPGSQRSQRIHSNWNDELCYRRNQKSPEEIWSARISIPVDIALKKR
jgi:hypothetical protein